MKKTLLVVSLLTAVPVYSFARGHYDGGVERSSVKQAKLEKSSEVKKESKTSNVEAEKIQAENKPTSPDRMIRNVGRAGF